MGLGGFRRVGCVFGPYTVGPGPGGGPAPRARCCLCLFPLIGVAHLFLSLYVCVGVVFFIAGDLLFVFGDFFSFILGGWFLFCTALDASWELTRGAASRQSGA